MAPIFQPAAAADLEMQRQRLLARAEGEVAPYSVGLRAMVLDLTWHVEQLLALSNDEKGAVEQARFLLDCGQAVAALAKLGQVIKPHLP
ncbi:hypothetical protein [Cupriavidus necator]